jgi:hypothetical protein
MAQSDQAQHGEHLGSVDSLPTGGWFANMAGFILGLVALAVVYVIFKWLM